MAGFVRLCTVPARRDRASASRHRGRPPCQRTSGPLRRSVGSAVAVDPTNTRWNVSFSDTNSATPPGNYWIRDFAPDYCWAIVSDARGGNGRLFTRDRQISPEFYRALVLHAQSLGVATATLTRTPHSGAERCQGAGVS